MTFGYSYISVKLEALLRKLELIYYRQSVGQSALVSGSHLDPITRFLFFVWRLWISWYVAPSLTKGLVCDLLVQLLLCLARAVTLGSKSRRTYDHILLPHLRLPKPGGPRPRIYSPQEQGVPDIPPALGSLSVASYDSQGYGGSILTRLHTGRPITFFSFFFKLLRPTVSRLVPSGYWASLWDPWPDFYLALLTSSDNYVFLLSKAPSLTRKRVCSLQCNHSSQVINAQ
jgi:hypothetical protein